MKFIYSLFVISVSSVIFFSCTKSNPNIILNTKVDTSKNMIANTILVGHWNILTDTISYQNNNVKYIGVATDHYIFTKYGNLFINEGFQNFIDTAVYSLSSSGSQVGWTNLFFSVNGTSTTLQTVTGPYDINFKGLDTLILTSNVQTQNGLHYEQIWFKKQ